MEPILQDGVWTGTGEGRSGTILVKITVNDRRITDIVVVNQSESSFAQDAIHKMVELALQKQAILSSEVDAISGATLTSNGMIDAINMAIRAAMGQEEKGKTIYKDGSCDIVIIGAGGAGLSAAVEAASLSLFSVSKNRQSTWEGLRGTFRGLAASILAFLRIFVAANPQNNQNAHSEWIGGKKLLDIGTYSH